MISGPNEKLLSRIFMINATWQEMGANLGYAGLRMWNLRSQVLLLMLSS